MRAQITRRSLLTLLASTTVLPFVPMTAMAAGEGFQAIILSDLHSAYERMGQLLAVVEKQVAGASVPQIILINGDIFELGNVVASRSGGEIDWAFLGALAKLAPTVVNIGNHEPDLDNDLAHFIERARGLGVAVLSNIVDKRTGKPYTEAGKQIEVGGLKLKLAAFATDAISTYPKATREMMEIPKPVEWAKANLPALLSGEGVNIVLSHAGVVPDRDILPILPNGTLMIGGHDHLTLTHNQGETRYIHTGSWSSAIMVATFKAADKAPELARIEIDRTGPSSAVLKDLIPAVLAKHLKDEERAVIAKTGKAMTLGETARFAAQAMVAKTGADIGFIGHTSFGTGLPAGDVSRFDFNAGLRFEGKLMVSEVDATALAAILARCNQDGDIPLAARTGDFLYAAPKAPEGKQRYKIVCNDWSAINRKSYFGREDIAFTEVPDVKLKQLVAETLAKG
ncbi:metallophosphoesterase [Neorhizobium galegae]|uniref:metallophosphoesterase n=1 Tax=Neorhizobium galegae TaxID=399 RepID=UPI00062113DF|nr:metallophosphoesterase [Neorhizobium galegae]KAB1127008.1 bifunctional metallophosphatase/5'-nucleotidase [Neorhizobium galegae]MCQ1808703.1 metallophosphoesterase [Neorhizobium galegae]CDZ57079.1 5'-nucleotidase, C-terminal domain protein [Neorhizobium galegae bv. orientalis]